MDVNTARKVDMKKVDERLNAKWDRKSHEIFVDIVMEEIRKGNKPRRYLNAKGRKNLITKFYEMTGKLYSDKQMKNHWDIMRTEWLLFKDLIKNEPELRWNEMNCTIQADDQWWEQKIKMNDKYKKFRNKNLSLVRYKYDCMFRDPDEPDEIARAASQRSTSDILASHDESLDREIDRHHQVFEHDEETGDTNDPPSMPKPDKHAVAIREELDVAAKPSPEQDKRRSESRKRKGFSVDWLHDDQFGTLQTMASPVSHLSGVSVEHCMTILNSMTEVRVASPLWCYAAELLCTKDNRAVFFMCPNDEARKAWLMHMYSKHGSSTGSSRD